MEDRYIHWHAGNTLLHDSFARVASSHWVTSDDEAFFAGLSRSLFVKGNAFLGCGSHLSPPRKFKVALEYGPFQRAHGWLLELAGLILYCTFLRWNLSFLLAQQGTPACGGNLEGLRRNTHQDTKQSQDFLTTYPPSPYSKSYLKEDSRCLWLALLVVGLKSYLPQRLRRLSVAALPPVSAGALTFSWLSTGRQWPNRFHRTTALYTADTVFLHTEHMTESTATPSPSA